MIPVFLFSAPTHQTSHFAMPSEEEQQPGPSGVSREELLSLLGLDVSDDEDDEEEETVEEEEEDLWCNQAMDDFDRQRTFQT